VFYIPELTDCLELRSDYLRWIDHEVCIRYVRNKTDKYILDYTRKNLSTCQQDVFAKGLYQACQQVVTMLLFYQVATRLSLTTCQQDVFATGL
jgi:hypothetical protein